MLVYLVLSILLTLSSQVSSQKEYSSIMTSRIVGGTNAKKGEFPFMASWYYSWTRIPYCGGSLVASNLVLTSAHCKDINGPIRIGCDVYTGPCLDQINVKEKIPHPSYRGAMYGYMLLELERPVNTPDAKIINLNFSKRNDPAEGDMLTVIGFGLTKEDGWVSTHLQKVNVPTVSYETCRQQYRIVQENIHLCAGYSEGGKDACQGDSGGPIFETSGGVTTQYGIVSFGEGCGKPGYSGVYSRLSGASDWLQEEICNRAKGTIPSYCNDNEISKPLEVEITAASKIPAITPTTAPIRMPTIFPTTEPDSLHTMGSPKTFSPSFPTESPTIYPTTSSAPSNGCTLCSDTGAPWMSESNIECSSIDSNELQNNCNLHYWIKGKYCQFSCYSAGAGYAGDYCCNNSSDSNDEAVIEVSSESSLSSTPSSDPDDSTRFDSTDCNDNGNDDCSGDSNDEAVIEVSSESSLSSTPSSDPDDSTRFDSTDCNDNGNDDCIICDDEAISWMVAFNISCEESQYLSGKCNNNQNWIDNKFCQLSCYNAGVGYEGDVCCNSREETELPTSSPTIRTTTAPTNDCTICDDIGNNWMQDVGIACKYSPLIVTKCNNNNNWRQNKFCQYSCYHTGSGYDGDNCCV